MKNLEYKAMAEYGVVVPQTRFNKEIPIWKVTSKQGNVILQYFEPYGELIPPIKFKIVNGKDSEWMFNSIIIELQYIKQLKNYIPHYLGHIIDMEKTKMTVIPLPNNEIEENKSAGGFQLMYKDFSDENDDKEIIKPIPIRPYEIKIKRNKYQMKKFSTIDL